MGGWGVAGWLAGWLVGWLPDWLVGWSAGWLVGWLAGWLVGWLAGWWWADSATHLVHVGAVNTIPEVGADDDVDRADEEERDAEAHVDHLFVHKVGRRGG